MAKSQARTELQRSVDDILTGIINNDPKARHFILKQVAKLTKNLLGRFSDGDNRLVQVFVKGNSALSLYQMNTELEVDGVDGDKFRELNAKWSDFDNQIIINPYLPKVWWYEILGQIDFYLKTQMLKYARDHFSIRNADGNKVTLPALFDDHEGVHVPRVNAYAEPDNYGDGNSYNGSATLESVRIHGRELKKDLEKAEDDDYRETYKGVAGGFDIIHETKMQSNVELCMGSEYLHPVNYFDNIRTLFAKQQGDLNFMDPDDAAANDYFPPAVHVLKDHLGKKVKNDSSIWINTTIGKFLLYRLIVRYRRPGIDFSGLKNREDINAEAIKFRGEVIDVSIPRRESEETLNQWTRFYSTIRPIAPANKYYDLLDESPDGVNLGGYVQVPDYNYQLEENINMINEVLTYTSGSAHKFHKRLDRAITALEKIEEGGEIDYAVVFNHNLQLDELYLGINSDSLKSYSKQLARILDNDYFWPVLDHEIKGVITEIFPKANPNQTTKFSNVVNEWFETFNVAGANSNKDSMKAKSIIEKLDKDEQYKASLIDLLKFTESTHRIHAQFSQQFKLELTKLQFVNSLRERLDNLDKCKCFFGGIVSAKLDLHCRLNYQFDDHYPLPFIPLYLVGEGVENKFRAQDYQEHWSVVQDVNPVWVSGFDCLLVDKSIADNRLKHIVAIKLIDIDALPAPIDESKLEELLIAQHTYHQLFMTGVEGQLKDLYMALAKLKSTNKGNDYSARIFALLGLVKEGLYYKTQGYNILFDTPNFEDLTASAAELKTKLDEFLLLIDEDDEDENAFKNALDGAITNLSLTRSGDVNTNVYKVIDDYIGVANTKLETDIVRAGNSADNWAQVISDINKELVEKLVAVAQNKQRYHHQSLYAKKKNNRIVTHKVDNSTYKYRVLRESGIADYIDHQISNARDFYLIEWLDKCRIGYKSKSINYSTTLARIVHQSNQQAD